MALAELASCECCVDGGVFGTYDGIVAPHTFPAYSVVEKSSGGLPGSQRRELHSPPK